MFLKEIFLPPCQNLNETGGTVKKHAMCFVQMETTKLARRTSARLQESSTRIRFKLKLVKTADCKEIGKAVHAS